MPETTNDLGGQERMDAAPASGPPPEPAVRWLARWEPADQDDDFAIYLASDVYQIVCEHLGSDLENELGGFLIGEVHTDPEAGRTVAVIDSCTKAAHTEASATRLRFGNDTWLDLQEQMETQFAGKKLIGWYHSHPRMSVFFSSYDLFIHKSFFREPWQVGLVVEPERGHGGFFRWRDGDVEPETYVGCREFGHPEGESVIQWANLTRVHAPAEPPLEPCHGPVPEPETGTPRPSLTPAPDSPDVAAALAQISRQLHQSQAALVVVCLLALSMLLAQLLKARHIEALLQRAVVGIERLPESAPARQERRDAQGAESRILAELRAIRQELARQRAATPPAQKTEAPAEEPAAGRAP